jgi:hypothetical protein
MRKGASMSQSAQPDVDAAATRKLGTVDVVSVQDIVLNGPIDEVWPIAFDYPSWQAYIHRELVAGRAGEEGEVFLIGKEADELAGQRKYCRTVKVDPPNQVIWRIYSEPGGGDWDYEFNGTVEYRLTEADDGKKTRFVIQVIKEFVVPYDNETDLVEVQQREYELQKDVENANLSRLFALLPSEV